MLITEEPSSKTSLTDEILAQILRTGPSRLAKEVLSDTNTHEPDPDSPPIDAFSMPLESEAQTFFNLYFSTPYALYPFIDEKRFRETYKQMSKGGAVTTSPIWLAMMNLIIALALITRHDEQTTAEQKHLESLVYLRRAGAHVGYDSLGGETLEFGLSPP